LNEWRDVASDEVDAALARAERYLFGDGRLNAGKNEESYAHAYRIDYLVRTLANTEDAAQRNDLMSRIQGLVDSLVHLQTMNGLWAHEYDNAFCTAAMLETLDRAKQAGANVPEAAINRGIEALKAARYDDGSFTYGGRLGKDAKPRGDSLKNSCGRNPGCEAALLAWGKGDGAALKHALAVYVQYYDRFEKVSKCDFHTDGELGGFFFFHDLYTASHAVLRLPPDAQRPLRRFFMEKVTSLPEIDGSFLDDHEIGKSCSTAYALLALKYAASEEPTR
jgi:hypothetical protein